MGRKQLACLLLWGSGALAHAACETGLAERMHAKLHPDRALDHELAVCEPWRGNPGRFIVVLPMPTTSTTQGVTRLDLDVLLVQQADNGNTERAKIVSRLFQPDALKEDAVRISQIRVDTARYALAPDTRAFGLRIARQGASREAPYSNETLSLYVPRGPKLAKVLDSLELLLEQGNWDSSCTGAFETVRGNLAIAHTESAGFADLTLRQTRSETRSSLQGEGCVTQEQPATFRSILLRYDGSVYRISRRPAVD